MPSVKNTPPTRIRIRTVDAGASVARSGRMVKFSAWTARACRFRAPFQCRQLCRSFFQNHLRREVRALSSRNPRPTNHIRDCSRFCEALNLRQEILLLPYPCCRVEKLIDTQTVFWGISADRRKHGHYSCSSEKGGREVEKRTPQAVQFS